MQTSDHSPHPRDAAGFTLPAILVVVGALLILAVGVILVVGIERSTARSFTDRQRAELAARAGLEEVKGIFKAETANDDFLVMQSKLDAPIVPDYEPAPHLFLARGKVEGGKIAYRYFPLFSRPSESTPMGTTPALTVPDLKTYVPINPDVPVAPAVDHAKFSTLPYQDRIQTAWIPVKDSKDRMVGRYAFWVEDLQSRVDPALVGNEDGLGGVHVRAQWPFPAPGLNPDDEAEDEHPLDQVALYAIEPNSDSENQGEIGKTLIKNRKTMISPDSLLAAAGINPPMSRLKVAEAAKPFGKAGALADVKSRAVEEGLAAGIRPYKEQPLVPFSLGIDPSVAGRPKLNLNKMVAVRGSPAVDEMAALIKAALPKFENRKGGLPASEDYLKTLAANAIDYADTDPKSTLGADYRGMDSYPLISEFIMRYRWENVRTESGRKYVEISASTYVELWNMTDQPVSGTCEVTHDARYTFPLGANPQVSLVEEMATALPKLEKVGEDYWYPPLNVSLKPNEYLLINCGKVNYKIDAGTASFFVPSPLILEGETYGASGAGYKLKWNGQIVDKSRGGLNRNDSFLYYPSDTAQFPRQQTRMSVPGHSYKVNQPSIQFRNNMGDPRMAYYINAPQDGNTYPDNYSPNRRNVRWGSIYKDDVGTKTKVHGRVMPSEWPDGGHNSTLESSMPISTTDKKALPDDPKFFPAPSSPLRNPPVDEAPMRLSGALISRFYSATELGRVYDPILWTTQMPSGANLPWGDVLTTSTANQELGGGNTLRIGRPEHPMFDKPNEPGMEAYRLLDLFHTGMSRSDTAEGREGFVTEIRGQVNVNSASRNALIALATGPPAMDPKIAKRTSESHSVSGLMAPPVSPYVMPSTETAAEAERIADAIILTRQTTPFTSASEIAEARDKSGNLVFGNKALIKDGSMIHRSDSAAEEMFARVYEGTTVRSRNFRVWVIGQAVTPTASTTAAPEVLAEVRKVYTVFSDPGVRFSDGKIDPSKSRVNILHENDF